MQDSAKTKSDWVWVSDTGALTGESNPAAKLSNADVDLILQLRDDDPLTWTLQRLARRFGVTKGCIGHICRGARRGGVAYRVRGGSARR